MLKPRCGAPRPSLARVEDAHRRVSAELDMPAILPPVPRPEFFDVVIFGSQFADWLPVLDRTSALWDELPQIGSVTHIGDDGIGHWPAAERRLVLPLRERNSDACPPGGWGLIPAPAPRATLGDKGWLAAFARAGKLEHMMPQTFASIDDAAFPCILKRTNGHAGYGVSVVASREHFEREMRAEDFVGRPVALQEYIEAPTEYTTHCVCVGGRIVWHCSYEYDVLAADPIRRPRSDDIPRKVRLPDGDIAAMERFLVQFAYDGIVNIDSKRRSSGAIAILEINTRFGGSLFRPANRADLVDALGVIIANAKWRGPARALVEPSRREFEAAA